MTNIKMNEAKLIAAEAVFNGNKDVAIVGSFTVNNTTGAAYIYNLVDGEWTQTVRLTTEIANSDFGSSVSINSVGNVAIVGAPYENNSKGAVYVYTLVSGIWTKTVRLATGIANGNFGSAVSVNNAGDVAIIGAPTENNYTGAAYVYMLVSGAWTQTARLTTVTGGNFGISVSIDSVGDIAIIGSWAENSYTGAAYVYTLVSGAWTQTARLSTGITYSNFGVSVSINSTGNVAIVGAYYENNGTGAVYVYTLVSGTWTQTVRLASGAAGSQFGGSVSINSAGTVAIIGAFNKNTGTEADYTYTLVEGVWSILD